MSTIVSATRNKNLRFVDNLANYKVHHNDTDIRGFSVKLPSGETIGEVEGLLADVPAELVRYVEVEVDDDVIERHTVGRYDASDRNLLLPVGLVDIDSDSNCVTIYGINFDRMIDYPRYNREHGYTTRYEIDTNDFLADFHEYGPTYKRSTYSNDRFRQQDTFDDGFYASKFYTGRR